MVWIEILKSFLIGVCAALPFGPVLVMVVQKTLVYGRNSGFVSGLGSMVVDTSYAGIGLFALALAKDFVASHQVAILVAGGALVTFIGLRMAAQKTVRKCADDNGRVSASTALSYAGRTALCALSNPGAILAIAGLLALFHLDSTSISIPFWIFLLSVAAGEASYWFVLTGAVSHFGNFKESALGKINRISGIVISVFGVFLLAKGMFDFIKDVI